jgi:4-hydroxybenzoate polyprenyltransferase
MSLVIDLVVTCRPKQWIKNLFLFPPLIFGRRLFEPDATQHLIDTCIAFALFTAAASAVYFMNDLRDRFRDAAHPQKRNRPIASGRLPVGLGTVAALALAAVGIGGAFAYHIVLAEIICAYLVLQILYSFALKSFVIVDVMTIAAGFVLRVMAGASVTETWLSQWILACTFLLALFLGFSKRRHELLLLAPLPPGSDPQSASSEQLAAHRGVLAQYTPAFLDQMIAVVTASTVMAYALYTMSPETVKNFHTHNLIYTSPFVLFGIFRYLYLVHRRAGGGDASESLTSDVPLLASVVLWAAACAALIANPHWELWLSPVQH